MKGESGLFLLYRSIDPASIYHNTDCNKKQRKTLGDSHIGFKFAQFA